MSTNLFYTFLLLLFITCCVCQCVYADESAPSGGSKSVELFKIKTPINNVIKPDNGGDKKDNITPSAFYLPFIVAADDVMVVLTGVNRTDDGDNKHVDILTKYITTKEGSEWSNEVTNGGDGWKTQLAYQKENEQNNKYFVNGLAAAAKKKKIYLLLLNETKGDVSDPNCGIQLVEGTVSGDTKDNTNVKWETKNDAGKRLGEELKKQFGNNSPSKYFLVSSVYLEAKQKIVFVLHGKGNDDNIYVFVSLDGNTENNVQLSYVGTVENGCYSAFFPWGDKIMMIPTDCEYSKTKLIVNESSNMGRTWTDDVRQFLYFVGFLQDKEDFTATTINGMPVLLFTQKKTKLNSNTGEDDVHVWFSDGKRVSTAGRIATEDNIASSRLLHTKNKLFGLHQNISMNQPENITLTQLDDHLKNITTVITSWKKSDEVVTILFKDTPLKAISITDGLVGFLSNRSNVDSNNGEWIDEYIYVNATMNKGKKVDGGGVKFEGKEEGAKWPVGKSKEDQPYNFTDPGFTLVANVTIGTVSAAQNNNSLLGVGLNDNKRVGLWCTTEGKWGVSGDEEAGFKQTSKNYCEKNREYHVALVYLNNKLSVYVDWEELKELAIQNTNTQQFKNITYFYFGADESQKDVESNVTVRNVLLYNRPFTENEIAKLKKAKNTNMEKNDKVDKEHPKKENDKNTNGQSDVGITGGGGNNGGENTTHENTTNNNNGNSGEEEENLTSQSEVSMVRRALSLLMLSLLLLLLDVFWVGVLL